MPFRSIVGHRRILSLLSRAMANGSLPPSMLFSGPDGVGKGLVARAVAETLNCTAPRRGGGSSDARLNPDLEIDACGACPACRRIARGIHADVLRIQPGETGSIKIEQVREAIDRTIYRPFEGARRVTIVNDADALMPAAQNALLKTLEEPPASSVFILVTARPDSLLPTVRSRCSQIRFARLSPSEVAAVLERDHKYTKREALAVAAAAGGSVGHALDVEAGELADARSDARQLLQAARAKSDARTRVERARDLVKGSGPVTSEREYLGARLQALSSLARDLGILATRADEHLLSNVDLQSELKELSPAFDGERALQLFAAVDRAQDALERNVSPKVIADWLALQI